MSFHGDFTPVLAKHSKNFNLQRALSAGVDDMQRNFNPMVKAVEQWREMQLTDAAAKLLIYRAFIEDGLDAPRHLAREVHRLYFQPTHDEFRPRTLWSLTNAFSFDRRTRLSKSTSPRDRQSSSFIRSRVSSAVRARAYTLV